MTEVITIGFDIAKSGSQIRNHEMVSYHLP